MRKPVLRCFVTVERKDVARDTTYNSEQITWVPLAYAPGSPPVAARFAAEVEDQLPSRSEVVTQGLEVARQQSRIRLRWRNDIDSSMRVRFHGEGADIVMQIVGGPATVGGGRKRYIELLCEQQSTEGANG